MHFIAFDLNSNPPLLNSGAVCDQNEETKCFYNLTKVWFISFSSGRFITVADSGTAGVALTPWQAKTTTTLRCAAIAAAIFYFAKSK